MFRPLGTNLVSLSSPRLQTRSTTRMSSTRFAFTALSGALLATFVLPNPTHAATNLSDGSAKTALPGGAVIAKGRRTAVVSATVSEGDVINAQRALVAANTAIARTRDFLPVSSASVAAALQSLSTKGGTDLRLPGERRKLTSPNTPIGEPENSGDMRSPLDAQDFRALSKSLKAERLVTVYITPGDSSDTSATFSALVESYDTNGALVGRGEGTYTAVLDAAATNVVTPGITSRGIDAIKDGVMQPATTTTPDLATRALGGAVFRAVQELNRPIQLRGVVISLSGPYQARISLSEYKGLRNGARIEFLDGETPVAYGTVFSVSAGEALVSVAPEAAFPQVYVNMHVRNVNNPTLVRAGKTDQQLDEREYKKFETEFAIDLVAAGLIYLAAK